MPGVLLPLTGDNGGPDASLAILDTTPAAKAAQRDKVNDMTELPEQKNAVCREGRPPWLGFSAMLLAAFTTIFDLFVVNVALPSMRSDLAASHTEIEYIVAIYELAFGILVVTGGRLGDLLGRRRVFFIGMLGFTLASALCGIASTAGILIGARALQGAAAALLLPQVYSSIRVNFPGHEGRRAFGVLGMALGLAAIAGQVIGGLLVEANVFGLGWRTIFLVNIPVGFITLLLARGIPESRSPERVALDGAGVVIVTIGLALLLDPLLAVSSRGWSQFSLLSIAGAALALALFGYQQKTRLMAGRQPLIDINMLACKNFTLGTLLVLLVFSTASAFFLSFAFLAQSGFGLSPAMAGSLFVPCSMGFMLASILSPRLVSRFGPTAIAGGAIVYAVAIGVCAMEVGLQGETFDPVKLVPGLFAVGIGQGLVHTQILNLILNLVEEPQAGMASGIVATVQQVGAAFGVAVVGVFFSLIASPHAPSALTQSALYTQSFVWVMVWNFGAICLSSIILFAVSSGGRRRKCGFTSIGQPTEN